METYSIKIVNGKRGWYLKVNGLFISHGFGSNGGIKAIVSEFGDAPYGSTEWVSIQAVRDFWHRYMRLIIDATTRPYKSVRGQLICKSVNNF